MVTWNGLGGAGQKNRMPANSPEAVRERWESGDDFGFWRFEPASDTRPQQVTRQTVSGVTASPESIALPKDLRKRGWTFVGPTMMYAFMPAMRLVNDHIEGCAARAKALQDRAEFKSPARMKAP